MSFATDKTYPPTATHYLLPSVHCYLLVNTPYRQRMRGKKCQQQSRTFERNDQSLSIRASSFSNFPNFQSHSWRSANIQGNVYYTYKEECILSITVVFHMHESPASIAHISYCIQICWTLWHPHDTKSSLHIYDHKEAMKLIFNRF